MKFPWSKLSPTAKRGLLVHALHWQAVQIGSLYVSVYLFRLGHGYTLPAWHALCTYLAIPLGYWLAAQLTRRRGPGAALRTGLFIYASFQAVILWLGPEAGRWAGSLGAYWGLGVGFYWQAWVLLMVDLSREGTDRDTMLGSNQAVYFLASFTGAPLAGWYLASHEGMQGYPLVFGLGLALYSLAWALSLPLKGRPHHGASALKRLILTRKPKGWNQGLLSAAILGVTSVGALFLPLLITFDLGGNEGKSGTYTALTALAGFVAAALVARSGHPERRRGFLFWSALAVAALTLPLALWRDYALVLAYGLGMAVAMSLFNVPLFAAHIRIIEASPRFRHRRADAMLLREGPLNLGRALVCALLLWGVQDLGSATLTVVLVLVALAPLANYYLLRPWLGGPA